MNLLPSKRKHFVSPIEVHRVLSFLNFAPAQISIVKYCPTCLFCNMTGSPFTPNFKCETCDNWFESSGQLLESPVADYIEVLKDLPLRNLGKPRSLSTEEYNASANKPPVRYRDLEDEDIAELEKAAEFD